MVDLHKQKKQVASRYIKVIKRIYYGALTQIRTSGGGANHFLSS